MVLRELCLGPNYLFTSASIYLEFITWKPSQNNTTYSLLLYVGKYFQEALPGAGCDQRDFI